MKNKLSTVILILYSLLIIIFSFNYEIINNITITIVSKINVNNIDLWYNIIHYIFIFIIYFGFSVTLTITCIEYLDNIKYILLYSILLNLLMIILVTLIKSFSININFMDILISLISIALGVSVQFLIKIKQINGGKYEK